MSAQTIISFPIRKKCNFYGHKKDVVKEDFSEATAKGTPSRYTPTVKKIITLVSSESESESDVENTIKGIAEEVSESKANNVAQTPTRRKRDSPNEHITSPSKQRKNQLLQSSLTPSTLMNKLNLNLQEESSPEKKENLQPRQLFRSNQYQNARLALHGSETKDLPGRESELVRLQEFLQKHLEKETSGSLYISGPPGTGKTACLSKIMQKPELRSQFKTVYINCITMKSAAAIYGKIIQELSISKSGKNNKALIEKYLTSKHKMLLLVLDEIDQLESKKQSVLYSIFEWPSLPNSKLILVGIANALDLTDRILPRLQARCELKPTLMHFSSYTKQQITDIISARLSQADASNVFTPPAIQLLAGKVAAISGDIRRALDISRRVIELAESEKIAGVLCPTNDNDTNTEDWKKQMEITERPVELKEVVAVLNGVYGSTQNFNKDTFPIQQKLLLCSLLLILNKGRNKDITVGRLHEVYKKVCKKRNICAADFSEFLSMCLLIETRGTLRIVGKNQSRLSKVNLQWDQSELESALQDKNMMAEIINDTSCL